VWADAWSGAFFGQRRTALAREVSAVPPDDDALFRADAGRERVAGTEAKGGMTPDVKIPTGPRYEVIYLTLPKAFHCLFNRETGECVRHYPGRRGLKEARRQRDKLNRVWRRKVFSVR
jgi:hypothetical protein